MSFLEIMKNLQEITNRMQHNLKFSYLEIYNEQIIDLLNPSIQEANLMLVEDHQKGVYVPDLIEKNIQNQ